MFDELTRTIVRATRKTIHDEGARAVVGNSAGLVYPVTESGETILSRVWITYLEGDTPTQEAIVNNGGVPAAIGAPVRIVERNNTVYAIPDRYGGRAVVFSGGTGTLIEPHGWTHRRLGVDPRYVEGLAFEPLLVRPSDPPALTVYVEPGWYNWNGNEDVWEGGDTGSLSAYVPGAADIIHFVIIAIDSATNTSLIIDGDDVAADDIYGVSAVGYGDIEAIAIAEDYIPLAVVELVNGQTSVGVADITFDLRRWMAKGGSGGFALDLDKIMTDANGAIMVDANGNVMVGA